MATTYNEIFDIFDRKVDAIDWIDEADSEVTLDKRQLLESGLSFFLLPRFDVEDRNDEGFNATLSPIEKEILATLMKVEWLKKQIASWRLIELQYHTKDWAIGNQQAHLKQLINLQEKTEKEANKLQSNYDRVRNGKIFDYSRLVGKGGDNDRL